MENKKEIRWKQRFVNFEKAFLLLERTVKIEKLSEAERGGLIQFYEVSFELSWKTMKDYLESLGFSTKSPRETIKQAFQTGIINDGHIWIDALDDRNLTTHIYDEEITIKISGEIIDKYYPAIKELYEFLKQKNTNG